MTRTSDEPDLHGGRVRVPRSRGALSGLLLVILGAWGLLIPLVGPYVNFGYTPNSTWEINQGRFWFEILPGAVTALGGILLLLAANRIVTSLGAWLAVAGGAWFVVGPTLRSLLHIGSVGVPIHTTRLGSTLETLLLFTGLGALILFLGAAAVGRLGVVSVRDVRAAQRRERDERDERLRADRDSRDRDDRTRDARVSRIDNQSGDGRGADPRPVDPQSIPRDGQTDGVGPVDTDGNGAHPASAKAQRRRDTQA